MCVKYSCIICHLHNEAPVIPPAAEVRLRHHQSVEDKVSNSGYAGIVPPGTTILRSWLSAPYIFDLHSILILHSCLSSPSIIDQQSISRRRHVTVLSTPQNVQHLIAQ